MFVSQVTLSINFADLGDRCSIFAPSCGSRTYFQEEPETIRTRAKGGLALTLGVCHMLGRWQAPR
jgi:hypothetical protein